MAVTLTGITQYVDSDTVGNWSGWDGVDAYNESIEGTNSYSILVRKNTTETAVNTTTASLPTAKGVVLVWLKSDMQKFYNYVDVEVQSSTNNFVNYRVADTTDQRAYGKWTCFALDYVNKGTETGTFAPASYSTIRVIVSAQNVNFRAVTNNWVDALSYGKGHSIGGTTTTDKLFNEAWSYEWNTDTRRYGALENFNGIIFCQVDLDLSGTALVSDGEVLVFADAPFGYDVYDLDVTGTATLINTSILTAGTKLFNLDTTGGTFSMTGGALEGGNTISFKSGDTVSGVVISNSTLVSVGNASTGCQFVNNTLVVIGAGGSLDGCSIAPTAAATVALETASLNSLTGCDFVGDGTGHAVELTDLGSGTMAWDCTFNAAGFASTDGSTGNEVLFVNVGSGSLTINVSANGDTPTIRTAGATVSVVTGQVTVTLTPLIANSEVRVYSRDGNGDNDVELDGVENSGTSFGFTLSSGTAVNIVVFNILYEPVYFNNYVVPGANTNLPVTQRFDRNYI